MKVIEISFFISALAALTSAAPAFLKERQSVPTTLNEYTRSGCKPIIFFWARGSTEVGNLGDSTGPPTAQGLRNAFGASSVAIEGVDYSASLIGNILPGGSDPAGIAELEALLNDAAVKCPTSALLVGGYSQGAALVHRAVEDRSAAVKARIAGVVTYGDTRNKQDGGRIPNFDTTKTLIICNTGDLVCQGTLTIRDPHFDYVRRVPEAVSFLVARAKALRVVV